MTTDEFKATMNYLIPILKRVQAAISEGRLVIAYGMELDAWTETTGLIAAIDRAIVQDKQAWDKAVTAAAAIT
jgi:hypothetical protein